MSYRPRGAWKHLPKTTNIRATDLAERPGNRSTRRQGIHGGQGFGPLAHATLIAAGPRRRRPLDPNPWQTGTGRFGDLERAGLPRRHEAEHRAARA